ncbi:UNVERIFIED_CONTAM: hypothetical protein K2H54_015062 [Gekko kuhli]
MKGRLGRRYHLHFLNALCRVCGAHGRGGRATLLFPKEAVALKVKEIMMDSLFSIEPKFLLAMRAVGELSKFQPPISRDLRASMVAWALGLVLGGSPAGHKDAGDQVALLQRKSPAHPFPRYGVSKSYGARKKSGAASALRGGSSGLLPSSMSSNQE